MKNKQMLSLFAGLAFVGLVYFIFSKSSDERVNQVSDSEQIKADATAGAGLVQTQDTSSEAKGLPPSAGNSNTGSIKEKEVLLTPEIRSRLMRYKLLQSKAALSPSDETEMNADQRDGEWLEVLGGILTNRNLFKDPNYADFQGVAIDVLINALKEGKSDIARDEIWTIIRDPQIEDDSIPSTDRKIIAGTKAELLYNATAIKPEYFQDIDIDLPGPKTQKIWKNVQVLHKENLGESKKEADDLIESDQPSEDSEN